MELVKFREVLNGTINYFLLGDLYTLKEYKEFNNLPDDLATEFTTTENGDSAVKDGIIIPMSEIENYPYTIIFNKTANPELLKEGNEIKIRQDGYILKITSGKLMLFTWWMLNNFTDDAIIKWIDSHKEYNLPCIDLENGWYSIEILGGQSVQESKIINKLGETIIVNEFEPTFEFLITRLEEKGIFTADIFKSYRL